MPNIIITNRRRPGVPPKFSQDISREADWNINCHELNVAFNFFAVSVPYGVRAMNITGGEPLLHPRFEELFYVYNRVLDETELHGHVLTDGVGFASHVGSMGAKCGVVLNYLSSEELGRKNAAALAEAEDVLARAGMFKSTQAAVNVDVALAPPGHYERLFDMVREYRVPEVRLVVALPHGTPDRMAYFRKLAPQLADLAKGISSAGALAVPVCGCVPSCVLSDEEARALNAATGLPFSVKQTCFNDFQLYVDKHLRIRPCYGARGESVYMNDFNSFDEVYAHFHYSGATTPEPEGECRSCDKFRQHRCGGGCLSKGE